MAAADANHEQGRSIEEYRAKARDATHAPEDWFDVIEDDFTPIEVKSTQRTLASGRKGRFRCWKVQHEKMVDQDGEYDFVVIEDDKAAGERTVTASKLSEIIEAHGLSWTGAGDHPMGRQVKIPWNYLVELDDD